MIGSLPPLIGLEVDPESHGVQTEQSPNSEATGYLGRPRIRTSTLAGFIVERGLESQATCDNRGCQLHPKKNGRP